jgi:hypothetical protein
VRSCCGPLEAPPADEQAARRDEGVMQVEAAFPADCESFELIQEGEGLLHDVAELAQAVDVGWPRREMTGRMPRCRSSRRTAALS